MMTAETLAQTVLLNHTVAETALLLEFGNYRVNVLSNETSLLDALRIYFAEFIAGDDQLPNAQVYALETDMTKPDVEFQDWVREGGKSGRKDAFHDLEDGRLLYKVRTGMNYIQTPSLHIAYGPCRANISQVINFILTQHMTYLQHQGALICHASAIMAQGVGVAFAAFSGGGKSTLALHLMNQGYNFVSNDRLFIHCQAADTKMYGVAKQPRINPGTIINNETLLPLLPQQRYNELKQLPTADLWQLEEKYDAPIADLYGPGRFQLVAVAKALVILNWSHDTADKTELNEITPAEKPWLLDAVMKSPGPFHYDSDGRLWRNGRTPERDHYLEQLSQMTVYEMTGQVNFSEAVTRCQALF